MHTEHQLLQGLFSLWCFLRVTRSLFVLLLFFFLLFLFLFSLINVRDEDKKSSEKRETENSSGFKAFSELIEL